MSEAEQRALARVAMNHYPGERGDRCPCWIVDLAMLPPPSFHAHDRLMRDGLVTFDGCWRLTEAGWKEIETLSRDAARTDA